MHPLTRAQKEALAILARGPTRLGGTNVDSPRHADARVSGTIAWRLEAQGLVTIVVVNQNTSDSYAEARLTATATALVALGAVRAGREKHGKARS